MPGYPIRTPWDHSSVDSSPRPIAASHVLHRLLMPRHPPYAHSNLTTQTQRPKKKIKHLRDHNKHQRCSHPLCNSQPTPNPHHTPQPTQTNPGSITTAGIHQNNPTPTHTRAPAALIASGPNRMSARPPPTAPPGSFQTAPESPLHCRTRPDGRCRPGTFTSVSAIEHPTTPSTWQSTSTIRVAGVPGTASGAGAP
jgi:hypothetical protein